MDTATQILVIVVSSVLSIFLVIGCVVLVMVAKLIKEITKVVDKAEDLVENASRIGDAVKGAAGKVTILKIVNQAIKVVKKVK